MDAVDISPKKQGNDFEVVNDLGDPHDWKMSRNVFFVKRLPCEEVSRGGIHLPDKAQKDNFRAEVIAIGDGIDTFVKPGDIVIIGGDEEQTIYADNMGYKGEEYLFIRPVNVLCQILE